MFDWVVFLILSYMSCLYILETKPLSVASSANYFSHSESCLFILFMISFAVQKLLILIRPHLFLFCFHYSRRWVINLAVIYVSVLPMLSSKRSFVVSGLILRSLIHFELIFMYGVTKCL